MFNIHVLYVYTCDQISRSPQATKIDSEALWIAAFSRWHVAHIACSDRCRNLKHLYQDFAAVEKVLLLQGPLRDTLHQAKYIKYSDAVFPGGNSRSGNLEGSMSMTCKVGPKSFLWINLFNKSSAMSSPSGLGAVEEDTNLMPGAGNHNQTLTCDENSDQWLRRHWLCSGVVQMPKESIGWRCLRCSPCSVT